MKNVWIKRGIVIAIGSALLIAAAILAKKRMDEAEMRASAQKVRGEQRVSVQAITTKKTSIDNWLYGTGTARAKRREILSFETYGRVTFIAQTEGREIHEGDRVQGPKGKARGQLLAKVDDQHQKSALSVAKAGLDEAKQQVVVAAASVKQAEAHFKFADQVMKREKALLDAGATSQEAFEKTENQYTEAQLGLQSARAQELAAKAAILAQESQVVQAQNELEKTRIYAPIDGIIAYKNLEVGWLFTQSSVRTESEQATLRSVPFVVVDPSSYEITVDVPARSGRNLKPGQRAIIEQAIKTRKKAKIEAIVTAVAPGITPGGRSIRVRMETKNKVTPLRDGEFVACRILVTSKKDVITVPRDALIIQDGKYHVFVVGKDEKAERRDLELGIKTEDMVEVLEGVSAGEKVATVGRFNVYKGALLDVAKAPEGK